MAELYQKYNVGTNDPSAGLLAATRDQKANLKDIVSSITDLQKNTEGQIIQANTQQATDMLKQRLAQEGLGILAKPIDTELALRPFGNMIDKATVDKTVTEQTNLLKNNFINQFSAESDNILAQTNDPIKARENLKQRLLAAGAPSTFADQEAVNYDLRKVAEIKNIAARENEALNIGAAKITEASRKGLLAGTRQKNEIIAQLPEHLRAAANTKLTEHLDTISTPSKYREATRKNILDSVRAETKALLDAEAENLKQKNQYASTVVSARSSGGSGSSTSSVRNGRSNNQRSFTALTDKNGNPIDSVAMALGNRVTNRIENWDSSSDAAKIRNLHNSIKAAGIDTADADIILKDAFDTAYKGDGIFGNNMSKKDIKTMEDRANILVNAYLESSNNNSSGSGGSSSSSSVIGPFTSAKGVADLISKRAKMERELSQVLLDTAIDNTLRGGEPTDPSNSAAPNALIAAYENYMNQAQSTPPAPTTGSVKRSTQTNNKTIPSQSAKAKSKDQIIEDIVANPFEQPKPVVTPKPRVTSPATVLNNSNRAPQSYSSQSPLLNWFKKKMSASSDY